MRMAKMRGIPGKSGEDFREYARLWWQFTKDFFGKPRHEGSDGEMDCSSTPSLFCHCCGSVEVRQHETRPELGGVASTAVSCLGYQMHPSGGGNTLHHFGKPPVLKIGSRSLPLSQGCGKFLL